MKACRNEEEDTTSRVVNKGSAVETEGTLEERVDRLIGEATQAPNRHINWNYGKPTFLANERFQGVTAIGHPEVTPRKISAKI